jgi:glycosyltransferase involved in cell wall biosynthesis
VNIVQITPGAGGMYCGGCFRDNALVAALRQLGHDTLMLPLYLPLTLDEADQSAGTPIFFSGVNVYLAQKISWFRKAPGWLRNVLASPKLLKAVGARAAKTRAEDVGELTFSMLRGDEGNQARELDELIGWLKQHHRADAVVLSNALLVGMAKRLRNELEVPVVCLLSGEDTFLDGLPTAQRDEAWEVAAERARHVDLFVAPSRYFAELMAGRLNLPADRVRVVYNGINLDGFAGEGARTDGAAPVLGYFARMCPEKGLALAVDTFIELRKRARVPGLRLHIGGGCGPGDEPFVAEQRRKIERAGLLGDVQFFPNVTREGKIEFLRGLDVFCTPALYGEAFGLYVIEALAAGVPVVQPRHAAFPELLEKTGGGLLAEANPAALALAAEELLLNSARARSLGQAGQCAVQERFTIERMARDLLDVLVSARKRHDAAPAQPQPA